MAGLRRRASRAGASGSRGAVYRTGAACRGGFETRPYVRPVQTRFGMRAPAAEKVVASVATSHAEMGVNHGAAAANALGLTTQVPAKLVYLTSGRSRRLHLGTQIVDLKHAPQWMLVPSYRAAG
jgi:hypothetical protein